MSEIVARKPYFSVRIIAVTAMLGAVASILMFFEFPLPFIVPSFVKFDFSDLPGLIGAFVVSPISGVIVCLIKNVVHIVTSYSAGIGELSNFIIGASMCLTAGYIYKFRKNRKFALLGCLIGTVIMGIVSIFSNYYIAYPFYMNALGFPLNAIIDSYKAINPGMVTDLWSCLIFFNAPFTMLKGLSISIITFIVYKPLSKGLKRFIFK